MLISCETCPISIKARECCDSNPETGTTKRFRLITTKGGTTVEERITVCDNLQTNGLCGVYYERPEDCRAYSCEALYALGLGAQRE